jgi:hypothetical protein
LERGKGSEGGGRKGGLHKNGQPLRSIDGNFIRPATANSSGAPVFLMFGRTARPWSRILVSLMLVLFVTDEKSVQAAAVGITAACMEARDTRLGARSMPPAVDQKLELLSLRTGVGVGVCGSVCGERENGMVLMRLRGGFTAKKSRKSKSKRKTLKLKYKIKKRVVQVMMVPPRMHLRVPAIIPTTPKHAAGRLFTGRTSGMRDAIGSTETCARKVSHAV